MDAIIIKMINKFFWVLACAIFCMAPSESIADTLCGDKAIQGEQISTIEGTLPGCGIRSPVRVSEVSGVELEPAAVINCDTAKALKTWIDKSAKKQFRRKKKLTKIAVAASYSCRARNNKAGAKLSEHSYGNAIDISAFVLKTGARVTVLEDWKSKAHGAKLKKLHKQACGIFGTVLGPEADQYHQDHFHFDVASHRSGAYCR